MRNWQDYYENLYKKTTTVANLDPVFNINNFFLEGEQLEFLNKEIEWSEVILSVNTLKDYSSPGSDLILNRDLTVLLHT